MENKETANEVEAEEENATKTVGISGIHSKRTNNI